MRIPTVHLNGTSQSELQAGVETALQAVEFAREKLRGMYPNGRDYYPQDRRDGLPEGTSHRIAVDLWLNVDARFKSTLAELSALRDGIHEQRRK